MCIRDRNINGYDPQDGKCDLSLLFDHRELDHPEIFVVNIQELVPLNAKNILITQSNPGLAGRWITECSSLLSEFGEYHLLQQLNLVGLMMVVFVRGDLHDRISHVETDIVKMGVGGNLGNKGALILRFNVDNTSVAFINCHLEAGAKKLNDRLQQIVQIHTKAFQDEGVGKQKSYLLENTDYKFFCGDTNFRITLPYAEAKDMVERWQEFLDRHQRAEAKALCMKLLENDQLTMRKADTQYLCNYIEGPITFVPTYKYDNNTQIYDTSKKQRTPSWCDRILCWPMDPTYLKQRFYKRKELLVSDHRPVLAYYSIMIKRIDAAKRDEILNTLLGNPQTEEAPLDVRRGISQSVSARPQSVVAVGIEQIPVNKQPVDLLQFDDPPEDYQPIRRQTEPVSQGQSTNLINFNFSPERNQNTNKPNNNNNIPANPNNNSFFSTLSNVFTAPNNNNQSYGTNANPYNTSNYNNNFQNNTHQPVNNNMRNQPKDKESSPSKKNGGLFDMLKDVKFL
eukprot:TRINITY_DN5705_c0_g1_i13.p1 TRINITY_DN5705_c0_g1~~TRINITY_DN5705_c0_g1_i13.p1  ORF type:complete len:510 (-),score=81.94 TRINITY_DN5705_c0_g1_i13:289-1818(-)